MLLNSIIIITSLLLNKKDKIVHTAVLLVVTMLAIIASHYTKQNKLEINTKEHNTKILWVHNLIDERLYLFKINAEEHSFKGVFFKSKINSRVWIWPLVMITSSIQYWVKCMTIKQRMKLNNYSLKTLYR